MNDLNRTDAKRANDSPLEDDRAQFKHDIRRDNGRLAAESARRIVIASTFTCELLGNPLKFWMKTLSIPAEVEIAPYAQLLQQLLNPASQLSQNSTGFNVLLLRLEDWIRDRRNESVQANSEHLRKVANELSAAVESARLRTSGEMLVFICPTSSEVSGDYRSVLDELQRQLLGRLSAWPRVHCWTHSEMQRLYPVEQYEDARSDQAAHIPYTSEYFVAIATLLARRIAVLLKPNYKVIAVDCDNTLWKGVCGEVGAPGVEFHPEHLKFQRMLVQQQEAGVLLCLCSKNNEDDVKAVFENRREEMLLREENIICSRVNWDAKSANLQSLAQELDLSLDSFIFVDDSAIECAEVQRHCPSVLTLQFPGTLAEAQNFLDHVWAFDRIGVTEEARQRTNQYRERHARKLALAEAPNLDEFLASLELNVVVSWMQQDQLARVAELVQRTSQFNFTGVRRSRNEIESLCAAENLHSLVVHVRDRFGDYGLVGAVLLQRGQASVDVDTFVLSCRVLGRGVEHRIVRELAQIARDWGAVTIALKHRHTARNVPAREFIEKSFGSFQSSEPSSALDRVVTIPVEYAENLAIGTLRPASAPRTAASATGESVAQSTAQDGWHEIAYRLSRTSDILRAIGAATPRGSVESSEYVAPRTPSEAAIAEIWCDILGVETASIHANFFDIGGDSLLAVQAIARIGAILGLELSVYEFFEGPTIAQIAERLSSAAGSGARVNIQRRGRESRVPLSASQERLWFIDKLEGGSLAYHVPIGLRLTGLLDQAALQAALDALMQRHEALRTTFAMIRNELTQVIAPSLGFDLRRVDLTTRTPAARQAEVVIQSRAELAEPFDLEQGPLIRGRLLRLAEEEHYLLLTMHHIVSDGWSVGVLVRELVALYEAFHRREPDPLQPLPIQYADYSLWQRQWLSETLPQEHLSYWKAHLEGAPSLLELPADRPRPSVQSYRGGQVPLSLGIDLTSDLKILSRRSNLTVAMTLYAAWSIFLSRISGQGDIVIGMPVANRRHPELEGIIGFFANTLGVRVSLEDDPSVTELLHRVRGVMLAAYVHQDAPFEQIVEALQPVRSLSHSPVFQVMFAMQAPSRGAMKLSELSLIEQDVPTETAQFDLLLSLRDSADGISGHLNYARDLFDAETIERWADCFKTITAMMVQQPNQPVSRLPLMDEHGRRQVVELFNATHRDYEREKLIHELFEEQVERTPREAAVVFENDSLTYAELNGRANQLAAFLRDRGVGPDQLVGICVERSLEMVVGLLGILKAGGAYVPVDPDYPPERLAYMLEDAAPRVLLIQERLRERLPETAAEIVALDGDWSKIAKGPSTNLDAGSMELRADHLAYVIYTSGSTGKPKGAMNEHRALINRLQWMQNEYGLRSSDRVLQKTPFSFDVSVWEFFWTLLSGARLIVARPRGHQDPSYLRELIEKTGVTTLHFVPSMLQIFLDQHSAGRCPSLRHVVCSGEELLPAVQNRCLELLPQARLSNLYGPTEAAIDVTSWECRSDPHISRVPIGRPIANTQMYVLDRHGQPTPIGVPGEIHIGGVGVGRGYLRRGHLTAERFVQDPFSADPHARLYKTGDLGRWRLDGAIEYLGRNDHQVKIRGLRIELGEIEAQLARYPQVKEVAVIAREDVPGEKQLVAYLVAADQPPSVELLRAYLKSFLPEYMVPSAFVLLEHMPLTPNGKLDRRTLPAPQLGAYASRKYEAPQGEIEEILAGIWQSLLRLERVGRRDNFFELGGHSLLIVQVMERLRRVGLSAELRRVFESATLADLAATLTRETVGQFEVPPNMILPGCEVLTPEMLPLVNLQAEHIELIVQSVPEGAANIQDIYPLVPLQEGILFHHLFDQQSTDTYVTPIVLAVDSRRQLEELISALHSVIDRHDILRTAILWEQLPQPVQVVWRRAVLRVDELTFDANLHPEDLLREWVKPERQRLDLRHAPAVRLHFGEDVEHAKWYVLLQLHHILGDATSLKTIISEVVAHLEGHAARLPAPIPYRNHVARALAQARTHDDEAFFRAKLAEIDEPTAPFGMLEIHGDGSRIDEARRELELALAHRIRMQARRLSVSAATLFHAAWSVVVAHTSGRDDVVFGSVLLGRLQGSTDAQRVLGMFINTLPLRMRLHGVTARTLVEQTQRELVELLSHEQASLAVAQRCSAIARSAPLFTSLLNYRHGASGIDTEWSSAVGIRMLSIKEGTNYPITLSVDDLGEGFALTAQTDCRVEAQRVIQYLETALRSLVDALDQHPNEQVLALSMLPENERRQIVYTFNDTRSEYPRDQLIHELFEEQVRRTPDAPALTYEDESLTYGQLSKRANQLAHYLKDRGVQSGEYIPVCMSRSEQMVIVQLAVLKAGGVYVPLDPQLPADRRAFMIRDCNARWVIADSNREAGLAIEASHWINVSALSDVITRRPTSDPRIERRDDAAAYVMYTSGSTGTPKGVIVPHHAVNRLAINNGFAQITPVDCVAHYSNPAFDASTFEVWGALLNGASVLVVPQSVVLEVEQFGQALKKHRVTVLWMSVGLFNQCFEALADVFRGLSYLIVGGDSLDPETIDKVLRDSPPKNLLNGYGPTECTTFSTTHRIENVAKEKGRIPIGRPIANARVYILDPRRKVVPMGVTGEIYIGGAGVACGYLGRSDLTAERFVPDPFSANLSDRLYRTGDLGRWLPEGVIEFLGRNDDQVKIRGFRIELQEIEAQLLSCRQVREAVVVARGDGPAEKRILAYIVPGEPSASELRVSVETLRTHLRTVLPEYMVPSAFVLLDRMPLTKNGKVDRRALPEPELMSYGAEKYEPPRGDLEALLAGIWRKVLHVERVGRKDNFFELGGHSLLAVKTISETNHSLGSRLRVVDLYRKPTISQLAMLVRGEVLDEAHINLSREALLPDDIVATGENRFAPPKAILLTGATGFVGRFLLAQLLEDSDATIYCLVRAKSDAQALARLQRSLAKWDLWSDHLSARVVAVAGDLRSDDLGLENVRYQDLCGKIDSIYHCATSMNHLETYEMAKRANVGGLVQLLRLATERKLKLLNYISTLSVFSDSSSGVARAVAEGDSIDDEKHLTSSGYATSKWIGEKIVMIASQRGIPCNIFRLGLVWSDARCGRYDELQREYRIIRTCLLSGYAIRNYRYEMPPTPVDYVARAVVFLANEHPEGHGIFHISSVEQMSEGVFERCNDIAGTSLELLSVHDWVSKVRNLHESGRSLPAIPLIEDSFSHVAESRVRTHFDCTKTRSELEVAGIVAPAFNDRVLGMLIENILAGDEPGSASSDSRGRATSGGGVWKTDGTGRLSTQRETARSATDI